ncbi:MAG: FtsW/RodA/SpoVE family cell cycle protein [Eubacterium sp.]|nr:FtsW/RodA/SpoVE family cell cycle protein [Eubacterium sp.]SEF43586.1 rod shape determining protein RodA [Eubacterium ruminantium]
MFAKIKLKSYNYLLLLLVAGAMTLGIVIINSADSYYTNKQIIGAVLGFAILIVVALFDYHFICKFYVIIYFINLGFLASVLLFGENVNNATRWFTFAGITFQPSELTKIFMIIFMAKFLSRAAEKEKLSKFSTVLRFMILLAIPILFIFMQPDLSTTLCITMVMITMYYMAGLSYKVIGIILLILIPLVSGFLWYIQRPDQKLLYEHQVNRIMSFIYPSEYQDDNQQQDNSVMAIGSGKLTGKGLNNDSDATVKATKLISEQQTDFIFSIVGEELGFAGCIFVIALILLIVLQCIRVARRAKDKLGMLIASGVACLIGYQSFINIGVATALLPNTGIPLPFISYGLSSLLSLSIGLGMTMNISMQHRKFY